MNEKKRLMKSEEFLQTHVQIKNTVENLAQLETVDMRGTQVLCLMHSE
jgi:hypothetical protein